MHMNGPMSLSPQCPRGEYFYVCDVNGFTGCCAEDPCDLDECPRALVEVGGGSFVDPEDNEQERSAGRVASTAMTDSGVTHTVPNDDVVTVTRHTMVVTGRPSLTSLTPTESPSVTDLPTPGPTHGGSSLSRVQVPAPTASNGPNSNSDGNSLSIGTIIGVAVGGAVLLIMLLAAVFIVRRHSKASRRQRLESERCNSSARDDLVEDKHFPPPVSAHTTGTQGYSDPFAPFGGRADEPDEPYRPPSNTFEMDGTSTAPVELPAISVEPRDTTLQTTCTRDESPQPKPAEVTKATDPRATLNTLDRQGGRPAYINHWNQYKEVGGS